MDRIPPIGSVNFADWKNGDRAAGIKGSFPPHEAWTDVNEELAYALEQFGFVLDKNDLTQVYELFRRLGSPGPADPPIAPNLPQLVSSADGTQIFPDAVAQDVNCSVIQKNNLINSTYSGSLLTFGSEDEGLYAFVCGTDFVGGAGAFGIQHEIYKSGVVQALAKDNRTSAGASNLGTNLIAIERVVAGETIRHSASRDDAGGGTHTPQPITTRFVATKLSV